VFHSKKVPTIPDRAPVCLSSAAIWGSQWSLSPHSTADFGGLGW
jgi:hypothetical protein